MTETELRAALAEYDAEMARELAAYWGIADCELYITPHERPHWTIAELVEALSALLDASESCAMPYPVKQRARAVLARVEAASERAALAKAGVK